MEEMYEKSVFFSSYILSFFCFNYAESGDIKAGETRYAQNCGNCHGPAGMGLASYPKLKGKEVPYLVDRLKTYRAGQKLVLTLH